MDDLNSMTLDAFKLWSVNALRVFLSLRNKPVKGNFEELTARAFIAWEEHIPVDEKAEELEMRLLTQYQAKLKVDGDVVPDPFSLTTGWKGEKAAMSIWPSIYVTDIARHLNGNTPKEVGSQIVERVERRKGIQIL